MAGVKPAGPVSGVAGWQFIDDNPAAPPEVRTGNPYPSPGYGYVQTPLRYPGRLYSQGYAGDPYGADVETGLIETEAPVPGAGFAGPGTPYFDATPNTHAGPWIPPYDTTDPDNAALRQQDSNAAHSDGLDNRKPGLIVAPLQDDWTEYYNGPPGGALLGDPGDDKTAAGWASTDITSWPENTNPTTDFGQHAHRRAARGHNLPMDFLWMPGSQRPLITNAHGLQALPVGAGGPYEGQDPAYGYGTAGAVLTRPGSDYAPPATAYVAPPLSQQGLREGPL